MDIDRAPCPECGEVISVEAKSCRFCHAILSDKDRVGMLKRIVAAAQTPSAPPAPVPPPPIPATRIPSGNTGPQIVVVQPRGRFRGRLRSATPQSGPDAAQLGMAIASMVIGIAVALGAIPGAFFAFWILLVLAPFAVVGTVLGYMGSKSAMGIAGMMLNGVALVIGIGFYAYIRFELGSAESARLDAERVATEDRNKRANQENERRRIEAAERQKQREAEQETQRQRERERASDATLEAARLETQRQQAIARAEEQRRATEEVRAAASATETRTQDGMDRERRINERNAAMRRSETPEPNTTTEAPAPTTYAPYIVHLQSGERIPVLSYENVQGDQETLLSLTLMSRKTRILPRRDVREVQTIPPPATTTAAPALVDPEVLREARRLIDEGKRSLGRGEPPGEAANYFSRADRLVPGLSPSSAERAQMWRDGDAAHAASLRNAAAQRPMAPARTGE